MIVVADSSPLNYLVLIDEIGADTNGFFEGGDGVFRPHEVFAAMRNGDDPGLSPGRRCK